MARPQNDYSFESSNFTSGLSPEKFLMLLQMPGSWLKKQIDNLEAAIVDHKALVLAIIELYVKSSHDQYVIEKLEEDRQAYLAEKRDAQWRHQIADDYRKVMVQQALQEFNQSIVSQPITYLEKQRDALLEERVNLVEAFEVAKADLAEKKQAFQAAARGVDTHIRGFDRVIEQLDLPEETKEALIEGNAKADFAKTAMVVQTDEVFNKHRVLTNTFLGWVLKSGNPLLNAGKMSELYDLLFSAVSLENMEVLTNTVKTEYAELKNRELDVSDKKGKMSDIDAKIAIIYSEIEKMNQKNIGNKTSPKQRKNEAPAA